MGALSEVVVAKVDVASIADFVGTSAYERDGRPSAFDRGEIAPPHNNGAGVQVQPHTIGVRESISYCN